MRSNDPPHWKQERDVVSGSIVSSRIVRNILTAQFITIIIVGLLYCLKDIRWGASAIGGGLAVWLPNALFMISAWRRRVSRSVQGRVAWSFAIGEVAKVLLTFALLAIALVCFQAVFTPLLVTWLAVLVVQLLVPAVINKKG